MSPGEVSQALPTPPICACQHFRSLHFNENREPGPCEADGCRCEEFRPIPFDKSKLGKAINNWLKECAQREKPR